MVRNSTAVLDDTIAPTESTALDTLDAEEGSTDIAVRQFASTPDFDKEDISFPLLRVAQGMTPEVQNGEAKTGDWLVTGYDPMPGEITVVVLRAGKSRDLREAKDRTTILCQSPDGKIGIGTPGGECAECPFAFWTPGDGDKNNPPQCSLNYNYLFYLVDHEAYCQFSLKRTGSEAAKQINSFLATKGYGLTLVLRTDTKQNNKGRFAVVKPRLTTKVDPSIVQQALETVRAY